MHCQAPPSSDLLTSDCIRSLSICRLAMLLFVPHGSAVPAMLCWTLTLLPIKLWSSMTGSLAFQVELHARVSKST